MTEFLLVGCQAWQKQRPTSERPIHFTHRWGWCGLEAEAEAMVMQRKQHHPRHPTRFWGTNFFCATGGHSGCDGFGPGKHGCQMDVYHCTVTVAVRWSLSVLAFWEDIKNPFARFYGAFGYGGELRLCKMCVVFCSLLFLISQDFHGFLKPHSGTVFCGGHHWPMWETSGPQWSVETPGDSSVLEIDSE